MEVSLVSKARTAFHSAAAKAEKVLADIKNFDSSTTDPDDDSDIPSPKASIPESINSNDKESKNCGGAKQSRRKPHPPVKIKQDWHERFKNIRIRKKGSEDTEKAENSKMAYAIFDENLYMMRDRDVFHSEDSKCSSGAQDVDNPNANIIPSTSVLRQLAIAIETGKNYTSMMDLMASSRDSSPVRERAALGFSAMKSLVLREKDEKLVTEFGTNEKVLSLIKSLLDAEGHSPVRNDDCGQGEIANTSVLIKDIHGAPTDSFVVKLSEAIGNLKTLRKMALFWCKVVTEVRRLSSEWKYIPGIPPDEIPDLNCCLLYQQLQVINTCISRKMRRYEATESLDSVITQASLTVDAPSVSEGTVPVNSLLYARTSTGELVLRLGADKKWDNMVMLETGQPVYTPVLQEAPLLTEDVIKETEEFVLRTGSVGAGCSQLLADMQAFKAANPGCILEDFVRWHSPPDWSKSGTASDEESSDSGDSSSLRGQLSRRMRKEGNLWRELWETSKPVPAMKQTPLFDEELAAEGVLHFLNDISPSELFQQLFISLLGSGFVSAEPIISSNSDVSKLFYECKDFIIATCQRRAWTEKIDEICQVYETIETMLLNPDEALKTAAPEETSHAGELKNRFKKLGSIFGGKDRQLGKAAQKEEKNGDENTPRQSFSSIFSKKPPKTGNASAADNKAATNSVENDWTIV